MSICIVTVAIAIGALLIGAEPAAAAAQITVSTRADEVSPSDGSCSLREAVAAVNTGKPSGAAAGECPGGDVGGSTVVLAGGAPYTLTLAGGGALRVNTGLKISGAGAAVTTIDGGGVDRVLDVGVGSGVSVTGVTITDGRAPDGTAASPAGGSGGGIRNAGVLTLTDVTVSKSAAGNGQAGMQESHMGSAGGDGGGIYNAGSLTLVRSTVASNDAGYGGLGYPDIGMPAGIGGNGGSGGGIVNIAGATLNVIDSALANNHAGSSRTGGHGGPDPGADGYGAAGGEGGSGGALWNGGTLSLAGSALTGNEAGRGGDGGEDGGLPGAIGGGGGRGGFGGGLYDDSASGQTIRNSTIAANFAGTGGDGGMAGGYGGNGGGGGGVVSANAALALVNMTVTGNRVGAAGADRGGGPGGEGGGGGISTFGSAALQNTIVASNSGGNCIGATSDNGHNLSFPDTTCPGMNGDPKLGDPQDNGGPTVTAALGSGSAALDQVPATGAGCPATDQRGVARPQGSLCDIGAFEAATPVVTLTTPGDGAHYPHAASVAASYSCQEAGMTSLIASCAGTVGNGQPVDTSTAGARSFTVTVTDKAGNQTSKTVTYTVDQVSAGGSSNAAGLPGVAGLFDQHASIVGATVVETRNGVVTIHVVNPNGASAAGDITLAGGAVSRRATASRRRKHRKKALTVAHATFTVPAQGAVSVKLQLSKQARAYLATHGSLNVKATVVLSAVGRSTSDTQTITIEAAKKKHRR